MLATTEPKIQITAAATDWRELERKVRILDAPCGGWEQYLDHPMTVGQFEGGRVTAIRVVRFADRKSAPTHRQLRDVVRKVWEGKFQGVSCQIEWDEGAIWSIEAVVEFEDGQRSELITDGVHVALQDHNGKSRFFRLLPDAQ